jgi:hypothetical protein
MTQQLVARQQSLASFSNFCREKAKKLTKQNHKISRHLDEYIIALGDKIEGLPIKEQPEHNEKIEFYIDEYLVNDILAEFFYDDGVNWNLVDAYLESRPMRDLIIKEFKNQYTDYIQDCTDRENVDFFEWFNEIDRLNLLECASFQKIIFDENIKYLKLNLAKSNNIEKNNILTPEQLEELKRLKDFYDLGI